ncbi:MAG: hypothetical protein V4515_11215 [Chloroflexota bacterium]
MPFGFGRKKDEAVAHVDPEVPVVDPHAPRAVQFRGFTEDWRLEGAMELSGRLLDLLNQRDTISVTDVRWAPLDGSADLEPAPGIRIVDPYDLIIVVAGSDTLAGRTDDERSAHRIHKVPFDVALDAPPFRVVGSVQIHPGAVPESLLDRGTQMFAAITDPTVELGEASVDLGDADAVLVNRFYLRGVQQVDRSTGLPYPPMPEVGRGVGD